MQNAETIERENANSDPITDAHGAHPVGTGLGAALGGAAAGAAVGIVAGPVGAAIGAAAGAIVGGLAGKTIAEMVDPTIEQVYWRDNFRRRPYVVPGAIFDDYGPAYAYGIHSSSKFAHSTFDEIELHLARDWDTVRGTSSLSWERASEAARDAWEWERARS